MILCGTLNAWIEYLLKFQMPVHREKLKKIENNFFVMGLNFNLPINTTQITIWTI